MPQVGCNADAACGRATVGHKSALPARLDPVLDALPAQIAVVDEHGWIRATNLAWRTSAAAGRLLTPRDGRWNYLEVCRAAARCGCTESARLLDGLTQLLAGARRELVMTYHCPFDSRHRWYQLTATASEFAGRRCAIVMHTDVTRLQRDTLTRLANRAMFDARLAHHVAIARRRNTPTGLVVLDLDGFKPVNDRHGHQAGDALLLEVAARLKAAAGNEHLVARIGGDEFALVPGGSLKGAGLLAVAERLCATLAEPFALPGTDAVEIGASIGVAVFPDHADDAASLLQAADQALYAAKRAGRSRVAMAEARQQCLVRDARVIALDRIAS